MSEADYLNATDRKLAAINIGYAEMNGAKTEYDDPMQFFGAGR